MNWLLIAIVAILVGYMVWGWHRGMIKMLMAFGTLLVSLVVSIVVAPYAQDLLCKYTTVDEAITQRCEEVVQRKIENIGSDEAEEFFATIEKWSGKEGKWEAMTETVVEEVSTAIASTILRWGVFLVTSLALWIVFRVVMKALDLFANLPIIHGMNKLCGGMLGLLQGVLVVWLLLLLAECFPQVELFKLCDQMIASSPILQMIQKWNVISIILLR